MRRMVGNGFEGKATGHAFVIGRSQAAMPGSHPFFIGNGEPQTQSPLLSAAEKTVSACPNRSLAGTPVKSIFLYIF
jgi:hypothetical protein